MLCKEGCGPNLIDNSPATHVFFSNVRTLSKDRIEFRNSSLVLPTSFFSNSHQTCEYIGGVIAIDGCGTWCGSHFVVVPLYCCIRFPLDTIYLHLRNFHSLSKTQLAIFVGTSIDQNKFKNFDKLCPRSVSCSGTADLTKCKLHCIQVREEAIFNQIFFLERGMSQKSD